MGIPTFFRTLAKKYPDINDIKPKVTIDHLFIDFNSLIYSAAINIKSINDLSKITINNFERKVINEVIRLLKRLINEIIKPNKAVYISIDGPAPRAKMIQQRSRRYKSSIFEPNFIEKLKIKYNILENSFNWPASTNASPGTLFMEKLSKSIHNEIVNDKLINYKDNIEITFSDSNIPGEGEHKFLDKIRTMDSDSDESICIYSPDGDVIVLAMSLQKKNSYLCRTIDYNDKLMEKFVNSEYLYTDISLLSEIVYNYMTDNYKGQNKKINKNSVIYDFVMLTFIFGNDFVQSLNFLKVRNGSYDILINYYKIILNKIDKNLIIFDKKLKKVDIDMDFFRLIFYNLSFDEKKKVKTLQYEINKCMEGKIKSNINYDSEYLRDYNNFQHLKICNPENPLYNEYGGLFSKINYELPEEKWKEQYYNYFTGINKENNKEYIDYINKMCRSYIESLLFCLKYYLISIPSWHWAYEFRVPPYPSDVYSYLVNIQKDVNNITFEINEPFTPFQQLMYILPSKDIEKQLPKKLLTLSNDPKYLLVQYYPIDFKIDALAGEKYIYSEAILPEIDLNLFLPTIKKAEEKLTSKEKNRNLISYKPFIKINKK